MHGPDMFVQPGREGAAAGVLAAERSHPGTRDEQAPGDGWAREAVSSGFLMPKYDDHLDPKRTRQRGAAQKGFSHTEQTLK